MSRKIFMTIIYGAARDQFLSDSKNILRGCPKGMEDHPASVALISLRKKITEATDGGRIELEEVEHAAFEAVRASRNPEKATVPMGEGPWKENMRAAIAMIMRLMEKGASTVEIPKDFIEGILSLETDINDSPEHQLELRSGNAVKAYTAITLAVDKMIGGMNETVH